MYIRKKNGKLVKITTHGEFEQQAMLEQQIQQIQQQQTQIATTIAFSSTGPGFSAGSLVFGTTNSRYIAISGSVINSTSSSFNIGSGSFTVEWFQNAINLPINSRVFSQRPWANCEFGVSIEGIVSAPNLYLWLDGLGNIPATANSASITLPYLNTWHHFAITRASGSYLQIFQNGIATKTITDKTNVYIMADISSSYPLIIGGEGDNVQTTMFSGSITNFRITKNALYSESFTVPTYPLTAATGTVLLLNAVSPDTAFVDSSNAVNKILSGSSAVSWSSDSPFW
jgi:hypothetical protein